EVRKLYRAPSLTCGPMLFLSARRFLLNALWSSSPQFRNSRAASTRRDKARRVSTGAPSQATSHFVAKMRYPLQVLARREEVVATRTRSRDVRPGKLRAQSESARSRSRENPGRSAPASARG